MERLFGENDPRLTVIPKRLEEVRRIIAVMSSKGGVGKTVVSTLLSLALNEKGYRVGLFDLDFTNPSTHIVLGIDPLKHLPEEEKGIIPPTIHGVEYLSIAMYSGDKPLPLRGDAVSDAFKELLAITRWSRLDYLLIDTPPGISDEHLDLLTYIGDRVEVLLVATPSPLAVKSIDRLLEVLRDGGYRVVGLVENMDGGSLREYCLARDIDYMGSIPYMEGFDKVLGDIDGLRKTVVWTKILGIVDRLKT